MTQPTTEQKLHQYQAGRRAIVVICDAWPDAQAAVEARGYPSSSPGPRAAAGQVNESADPLHTRTISPAKAASAHGDSNTLPIRLTKAGDPVVTVAERWLSECRGALGLLLRISPNFGVVDRGKFYPPAFQDSLTEALSEIVTWWPRNIERLLSKLQGLANTARREWPRTPTTGQVIGQVAVGERANLSEVCTGCHEVIGGGAEDPIRRIDGQPYHLLRSEFPRARLVLGTGQDAATAGNCSVTADEFIDRLKTAGCRVDSMRFEEDGWHPATTEDANGFRVQLVVASTMTISKDLVTRTDFDPTQIVLGDLHRQIRRQVTPGPPTIERDGWAFVPPE